MTRFKPLLAFLAKAIWLIWSINSVMAFGETPIEDLEVLTSKILSKEESPYLIDHDILVRPEGELLIEPGVEIRFAPEAGITVRGILKAEGTAEAKIKFVSLDPIEQVLTLNNSWKT